MSVGKGLNPVLDCVDIFFLGLLGWKCLRIVYVVIVNVPTCCVMLLGVFPLGGLSTLLYYLLLIVYTCLMPPVLYSRVYTALSGWTPSPLDFVTTWVRMNPWND